MIASVAAELAASRRDLEGGTVRGWRFLMAMVEHEVHHRSQLDAWLAEAGVEPAQLSGYRMGDDMSRVACGGVGSRGCEIMCTRRLTPDRHRIIKSSWYLG